MSLSSVFNSNQSSTPSSAGNFSTSVAKDSPTYTYAVSDTGNKVYAAVSTNADGSITINAQSTAEAMVLLNPLLIPRTSDERTKIADIVKFDTAVRSLAIVIESVYGSVADPLSDARIAEALTSAVSSVLISWQASKILPANAPLQTTPKSFVLAYAATASGSSSLQIINNDMGALTLANSAGPTLKLELNNVGVGGITTNVDWVVRIVELDPAKIQWTQYGGVQLQNPTLINIDSLIKIGGYDQKTIIQGAIGSGLLKFVVDPIGKVADSFGAIVFPDNGINLPHDGVYAVIALSGSPFGDSTEYSSVKNSAWQKSQWAEAAGINMISAAIDVVGVGTTFANAAGASIPDISPLLAVELGVIKTELAANPDYVGTAGIAYFVGKTADISDKLLDYLRPYIHSSISDLQSLGMKKLFHIAVNTAKSVVDVWSGTVSAGTRVANFTFNVTPRESGYAVLGTFATVDTTPPTAPAGISATAGNGQATISWNAVAGATSYNIYMASVSGVTKYNYSSLSSGMKFSGVTSPQSITGMTNGTTYYFVVTAVNANGESSESSQVSATPQAATQIDTSLPTVDAFSVNPSTYTLGQSFTISYTVSDSGGSGLKQIGLWRANISGASNDSSWAQIGNGVPLSGNGPYSSTFTDAPPAVGNYWYGIHVIDNANPTVVAHESVPLSVTVTSVPSTSIERITNGSFSSGTSGWTLSGDFWAGTNLTRYFTSPGYASGGVDSAGAVKNYANGYMYQAVTIPSNATSATLSFWLNITSDETGSAYDYLFVEVLNSSGTLLTTPYTFSNVDKGSYCGTTCTYSQKTANLISYKGQTVLIRFRATTDYALSTVFRIDDVSLMADGN